jgi:RNA polymerase sigma factor (sigma-70 family)
MFNPNNGTDKQEILQNQFTAYVKRAIRNKRIRYLSHMQKVVKNECSLTELEPYVFDPCDNMQAALEMETIRWAMGLIHEKERRIIMARVVEEKNVVEIAKEMGISYRAVTSLYYRGMKKLRDILIRGEPSEF